MTKQVCKHATTIDLTCTLMFQNLVLMEDTKKPHQVHTGNEINVF